MNIFILGNDQKEIALYHCNRHILSQIKETAQLLSTAVRLKTENITYHLYKKTHQNHPCSIWTRASKDNFIWLYYLGLELCKEYTHRYKKIHKSQAVIENAIQYANLFPNIGLTPFAQAMPDDCKGPDAVEAYRKYYIMHKQHLLDYKNRSRPEWLNALKM